MPTKPRAGRRATPSSTADFEVDVGGRWDAAALCELLVPFHSYLVQYSVERWVVYGRVPGCHGESLDIALDAVAAWQAERNVDGAVRVGRSSRAPR